MGDVPYKISLLSPEQVTRFIDSGRFSHAVTVSHESSPDGTTAHAASELSTRTATFKNSFLRIENGYESRLLAEHTSWPILFVRWKHCGVLSCDGAKTAVKKDLEKLSSLKRFLYPRYLYRTLPEATHVSAVHYGDANRDGLTDVLVLLSNGAALLYEQRPPRLDPRKHSRPPRL